MDEAIMPEDYQRIMDVVRRAVIELLAARAPRLERALKKDGGSLLRLTT
jgi:hypothetical protein